jgi:hypothetical protein
VLLLVHQKVLLEVVVEPVKLVIQMERVTVETV